MLFFFLSFFSETQNSFKNLFSYKSRIHQFPSLKQKLLILTYLYIIYIIIILFIVKIIINPSSSSSLLLFFSSNLLSPTFFFHQETYPENFFFDFSLFFKPLASLFHFLPSFLSFFSFFKSSF